MKTTRKLSKFSASTRTPTYLQKVWLVTPSMKLACQQHTSYNDENFLVNLKLLRTFYSQGGQTRQTNLAILLIEYAIELILNYDDIISEFASIKARNVKFQSKIKGTKSQLTLSVLIIIFVCYPSKQN